MAEQKSKAMLHPISDYQAGRGDVCHR